MLKSRKARYFLFLFFANYIPMLFGKWDEGFGWFSVGLYVTIVLGIEGNKIHKSYFHEVNNEKDVD